MISSLLLVPLFLMLTLVSCWFVPRTITIGLAIAVVGAGLVTGVLEPVAIPALLLLAGSGWWLAQRQGNKLFRVLAGIVFILTSIALASHWLPGFHNVQVLNNQVIKGKSAPFTLFYNVDKPWVALVILLSCIPLLKRAQDWKSALQRTWLPVVIMLPVVFGAGLLSGFVRWQPELPQMALLFLLNNLLFTVLAEEAFFRGFIQKSLTEHWQHHRWGNMAALALAAMLFGLAHFAGGPIYMVLAALAGAFYGWSYQRSGSVEMAVLSHWLLNTGHFLFFTYPVAAG